MSAPLLYDINDAADMLSISRSKFYMLMAAGDIAPVYIGTRRLVTRAELERYIGSLTSGAKS